MTIGVPHSRRGKVLLCSVTALALVLAMVFVVRWQHSVGHRAGEYADSFRDMPGVASVNVDDDGDRPRDLAVHLSSTASRPQVQDVHDRISKLPRDVVDDVTITLGAVSVEADADRDRGADLQWALRGLRNATVEVDSYSSRVSVRAEKYPAVVAARQVITALDVRGFSEVDLRVSGADGSRLTVDDKVRVAVAHTVLNQLAPVATYVGDAALYTTSVNLALASGASGRMTTVAAAAKRAAGQIEDLGHRDDVSFTVSNLGDSISMTGDANTALKTSLGVRSTLIKKGWTVTGIQTDLSGIGLQKKGAAAANLSQLRRDLESLHPSLPDKAVVILSNPDRDRVKVFSGTLSQLRRLTSPLAAMERDGYRVFWETSQPTTHISVLLPEGTAVSPKSIREVAGRLRAIGWSGAATIVIQQQTKNEDDYVPPYVTFSSTAQGSAAEMRLEPKDMAAVTMDDATRAWNSSAKK